jgi:hypothetical protein
MPAAQPGQQLRPWSVEVPIPRSQSRQPEAVAAAAPAGRAGRVLSVSEGSRTCPPSDEYPLGMVPEKTPFSSLTLVLPG